MPKITTLYASGYVIHFSDGGPPVEQVLHVGTLADCERVYHLMPGVAYSGDRPVLDAEYVIVPMNEAT